MDTPLAGLKVVESDPWEDERGSFMRCFCARELADLLGPREIVQINHSGNRRAGTVRGMHFQHPPHAEMKLVRCLRGRVWDVAVDLRKGSPTLLRWHAEELSQANHRMMVIPEGFAHGFQVLDPDSDLLYLHTACYAPEAEAGVPWNDPALGIAWPMTATGLSSRDAGHPPLVAGFTGVEIGEAGT